MDEYFYFFFSSTSVFYLRKWKLFPPPLGFDSSKHLQASTAKSWLNNCTFLSSPSVLESDPSCFFLLQMNINSTIYLSMHRRQRLHAGQGPKAAAPPLCWSPPSWPAGRSRVPKHLDLQWNPSLSPGCQSPEVNRRRRSITLSGVLPRSLARSLSGS